MTTRRKKLMNESGQITYSKADVREEWEAILAARRRLAEMEGDFVFMAQFLRRKGRADWLPADAATLLNRPASPPPGVERRGAGGRRGKLPAERGTWASEILLVVANHPGGVSGAGVREALTRSDYAAQFARNPNGFYNATRKLEASQELVKYRGHFFTKANMDNFLAKLRRGEVEDLTDSMSEKPTIIDMLSGYLSQHTGGVSAHDIAVAMEAGGMARGTVYNNLSKAVMKGRVRREGKLYFPLEENEPPR